MTPALFVLMHEPTAIASNTQRIDFQSRLFGMLPQVYYRLSYLEDWTVTYVNDHVTQMLQYSPGDIYQMKIFVMEMVIHRDDIANVRAAKNSAEPDILTTIQFRAIAKDGEIKHVRDQFTRYQVAPGQWVIDGCISETQPPLFRDRLFNQLQAYRNAVDVNMISSITDRQGVIIYANENFCKISKYSMDELIGQKHNIVNSKHHPTSFFTNLWKTICSGQLWHGEILNRAKDGTLYWVDTVIIPIADENKKIVNYLSLRMVINDRKEVENHRRRYTHLLEQIAFIVAHDIRGPVCSILGLTNLLLDYKNSPGETEKALQYLNKSAEELEKITEMLAKFVDEHEIATKVKNYTGEN